MLPAQRPIGIFDSGIGGLTVTDAVVNTLPNESILYFGDTAHLPYGPQPPAVIRSYSLQIARFLLSRNCKLIVVACNTATAAALELLRTTWPEVPFVGMEPAVKPAAQATRTGKVGVLATRGTFQSERYQSLMQRYGRHVTVMEDPCLGLVERIEAGDIDSPGTEALLRRILLPMLNEGVDTFVLGCTHYPFVQPLIEHIVGPRATVINPAPAVARQVSRVLSHHAWLSPGKNGPHQYFATGDDAAIRRFGALTMASEVEVIRAQFYS